MTDTSPLTSQYNSPARNDLTTERVQSHSVWQGSRVPFVPQDRVSLRWVLAAVAWELILVSKLLPSPWNRCENSQGANVTRYSPVGIL